MPLPDTITVTAHRYSPEGMKEIPIEVSAEYSLSLLLNGRPYLAIACSGSDMDLLAVGHLVSEGIIVSMEEVARVEVDEAVPSVNVITAEGVNIISRLFNIRTLVSGCAGSGNVTAPARVDSGNLVVKPSVLLGSARDFLGASDTHRKTHGVHAAALYDTAGSRLAFFDEIGRHNAVDKLLGRALIDGIGAGRCMLLSTGRISSEIVLKAAKAGIPLIATRAAPTGMAIGLARDANIILVTGISRDSFYIHHGAERIMET